MEQFNVSIRCFGCVRKVSRSKVNKSFDFFCGANFRNAICNNFVRSIVMIDEKRVCRMLFDSYTFLKNDIGVSSVSNSVRNIQLAVD